MLSFTQWTMSFHTVSLYCHIIFKNNFFAFCFFYDEQWKKAYVCLKVTCLYHGWWVFIHDFEFPSFACCIFLCGKTAHEILLITVILESVTCRVLFHGITMIFLTTLLSLPRYHWFIYKNIFFHSWKMILKEFVQTSKTLFHACLL